MRAKPDAVGAGGAASSTEQAVSLQAFDGHGQHLSDDVGGGNHMRGLQLGGAADDLARIAGRAFKQHIDRRCQPWPC